jgi:hypothetical protein
MEAELQERSLAWTLTAHLVHWNGRKIGKPPIPLTVGFTAAFVAGSWCQMSQGELEQREVEVRWMERLRGGGDREDGSQRRGEMLGGEVLSSARGRSGG